MAATATRERCYCADCGLCFESELSLQVHLHYHQTSTSAWNLPPPPSQLPYRSRRDQADDEDADKHFYSHGPPDRTSPYVPQERVSPPYSSRSQGRTSPYVSSPQERASPYISTRDQSVSYVTDTTGRIAPGNVSKDMDAFNSYKPEAESYRGAGFRVYEGDRQASAATEIPSDDLTDDGNSSVKYNSETAPSETSVPSNDSGLGDSDATVTKETSEILDLDTNRLHVYHGPPHTGNPSTYDQPYWNYAPVGYVSMNQPKEETSFGCYPPPAYPDTTSLFVSDAYGSPPVVERTEPLHKLARCDSPYAKIATDGIQHGHWLAQPFGDSYGISRHRGMNGPRASPAENVPRYNATHSLPDGKDVSADKKPRPFTCEVCNKHFIRKGHLNRHLTTTAHKNAETSRANGQLPSEEKSTHGKGMGGNANPQPVSGNNHMMRSAGLWQGQDRSAAPSLPSPVMGSHQPTLSSQINRHDGQPYVSYFHHYSSGPIRQPVPNMFQQPALSQEPYTNHVLSAPVSLGRSPTSRQVPNAPTPFSPTSGNRYSPSPSGKCQPLVPLQEMGPSSGISSPFVCRPAYSMNRDTQEVLYAQEIYLGPNQETLSQVPEYSQAANNALPSSYSSSGSSLASGIVPRC